MRSTLSELPVLTASLWGGLIAGLLASLLRLPGRLYSAGRRGRRESRAVLILKAALDVAAAGAAAFVFAAVTVYANGGELRLYAVCAYALGFAVPNRASSILICGRNKQKITKTDKK